jgi:4-amino-4-deoxy-L-arabinose transferase-like glycosyltransferase
LTPADATDPRLARIIELGNQFHIKDLTARNGQRWASGGLIDRWEKVEPNPRRADEIAKETALRAFRHNPLHVLRLAEETFAQYWGVRNLVLFMRSDLGHNNLTLEQRSMLAERFHLATDGQMIRGPLTLLQYYFLISLPYCYFLLLSPILGVSAVYFTREKQFALLLLVHLVVILAVVLTFTEGPSVRYLQPVSVLMLLTIAVCLQARLHNQSSNKPASTSQ